MQWDVRLKHCWATYTCRDEYQRSEQGGRWGTGWQTYSPQTDGATWTAVTGTRPKKVAWPLVSSFIADNAMLKFEAASIANRLMDVAAPWGFVYVTVQQVPQPGEFQPVTAGAPPTWGNLGKDPRVVKWRVRRPLDPSEHATVDKDRSALSYPIS